MYVAGMVHSLIGCDPISPGRLPALRRSAWSGVLAMPARDGQTEERAKQPTST
jgi:hypothetical protein